MRVFALAVALLIPSLASAQVTPSLAEAFIRQAWGSAEGLPQNSVTAILQTRDGYLWLGTFGGLIRFDGHAFTIFDPGNTPGLASARIVRLHEDHDGVLWIGTESGLTRYDAGRFTTYSTSDGLPHDGVLALMADRRGRLWIGTGGAPARRDGTMFERFMVRTDVELAQAFAETPDGHVWVASGDRLQRFVNGDVHAVADSVTGGAESLLLDSRGRLWAGSTILRRRDAGAFVDVSLGVPRATYGAITAMAEDPDGALWLGTTRGGLFRWRDGVVDRYTAADGLTDNAIRSLHVDRDGNIWIGTDVGGLNRLKRRRALSYVRAGSSEQSIGPIVGDGAGGLWIGATCGGLLHFRAPTLRVHEISARLHGCIWSLHRDADDTLWIGSMGGGLARLRHGQLTTFTRADGLPSMLVNAITRARDGTLWVGTDVGLARFDGRRFTPYTLSDGLQPRVRCIREGRDGTLWIGSAAGLTRLANGQATTYTTAEGLSHDLVRDVYEDADGILWIGTYGGGLNRFTDGRFTAYRIEDGLHDNAVSRIIEDDRGNLWMSGNKGVYRVARSQLNAFADGRIAHITSVSYGMADGMIIDETNGGQPAGWRADDGRLWFPTIKGLVGIEPVTGAPAPPPLFLERTMVQGRPLGPGAIPALGPGAIDVEFHYTAVDLSAAEKTRFRYRLDGYDEHWIDAGTRRMAYYTRIPPGRYTFTAAATDSEGAWSATPIRVPIVITPFWWQRIGVQAGALLLLLTATILAVRHIVLRRARARVAELEREHALDRERSRIARDLHDDLGSRLAHIALMADASGAAGTVATATRDALRTMDELVWTVNARNDTVESFAQYASEFVQELATAAGLRCRLQIAPTLDTAPLAADVRRHLYLALKEAVHNVIKHAGASEVTVGLATANGRLQVVVADDGRGVREPQFLTGNGLRNLRERMTAAGGTMRVESGPGTGCRLTLTVPLMEGT